MSGEPREYYENRLNEQLRELAEEIEELETRLDEGGWEPLSDYDQQVSDLRVRLRETGELMNELKTGSDAAWFERMTEVEEALRRIGDAVKDLSASLDELLPE